MVYSPRGLVVGVALIGLTVFGFTPAFASDDGGNNDHDGIIVVTGDCLIAVASNCVDNEESYANDGADDQHDDE